MKTKKTMNRLKTEITGGFNLFGDDLAFIDASIRDSFFGLLSAFGITPETSFIVSGCEISQVGLTYSWTGGYIAFQGDILKVIAGSVTVPGSIPSGSGLYWGMDISYDSAGVVRQSTNTYEVRHGKLVYGVYPVDIYDVAHYMPWNATTLASLLINSTVVVAKLNALNEDWHEVSSFPSGWANNSGWETIGYRKDVFGIVHLKGDALKGSATDNIIFILPVAYRPAKKKRYGNITIDTDGSITSTDSNTTLEGINFKI